MRTFILALIICITLALASKAQERDATITESYKTEIRQLGVHPKLVSAFSIIENLEKLTVANHIALTEIEAPPFKEEERAKHFLAMIKASGIDEAWIDEVGNVIGLRKGKNGKRKIAFDAHLDTVFPEGTDVKVSMRGDTMYAPGIGDDTRGLAMLITTLKAMNEAKIQTVEDVYFIGSVGEEGLGDLRGVKYLFSDKGIKFDSWISIDGGDLGRVNTDGLGSYRYRVHYKGPGGHSWGAFGLVNPHHALGRAIDLFSTRADAYTMDGIRTSYNVGVIGGGTSVNSIAYESWMEVDMRSESPDRLKTIEKILLRSCEDALQDQNGMKRFGPDLQLVMDKIGDRPSGSLSSELPLIQRAMAATAFMGKRPRLTVGSTNSNIPISLGIPAVTLGRGGSAANAHSLDEWFVNKEGFKAIQLALMVVLAEAGMAD